MRKAGRYWTRCCRGDELRVGIRYVSQPLCSGGPLCPPMYFGIWEHLYWAARGIHLRPPPRVPWELYLHNKALSLGLGGFQPTMDTPLRSIRLLITCLILGEHL